MGNSLTAEIAEFLTWNEGKTKIVQCVTMGSISHSEIINKFRIKIKGLLTQINAMKIANARILGAFSNKIRDNFAAISEELHDFRLTATKVSNLEARGYLLNPFYHYLVRDDFPSFP
jgi:ribosomal protein S9